jgi:hypothetical protein
MNGHSTYERMAAAPSTLSPVQSADLATHLTGCAACRVRAEDYARQDAYVRAIPLGEPPQSVLPAVLASAEALPQPRSRLGALGRVSVPLLVLLALLVAGTVALAAGGIIRVYHPETPISPGTAGKLFFAPVLPPYPSVHYRALDPATAARQSGYAVAYLRTPPADIHHSVGVDVITHAGLPATPPTPMPGQQSPPGLAVAIRSVVRYGGDGHTVLLTLVEPSPQVIRTRELLLGQRTVRLPSGQDAWGSSDVGQALPFLQPVSGGVHVLAWVSGHYVVTMFSDLSFARLKGLAGQVAVIPPASSPSQRHVPSSWPAPMTVAPLPARLRVRVDGSALSSQTGNRLKVRYLFNFGSYSQGGLYGLDKWSKVSIRILFPPSLRSRTRDKEPHQRFGGGGMGMGGSITFNTMGMASRTVTKALQQGVIIRVAWTEKGARREQTFHYPIIPASRCNPQDPSCAGSLGTR